MELDGQGRAHFVLAARGFAEGWPPDATEDLAVLRQPCTLGLRGLHNVANACAAAAVGLAAGMDLAAIARALEGALPETGRQELLHARGGFVVVNDAYNANPDSMRASLATVLRARGSPARASPCSATWAS